MAFTLIHVILNKLKGWCQWWLSILQLVLVKFSQWIDNWMVFVKLSNNLDLNWPHPADFSIIVLCLIIYTKVTKFDKNSKFVKIQQNSTLLKTIKQNSTKLCLMLSAWSLVNIIEWDKLPNCAITPGSLSYYTWMCSKYMQAPGKLSSPIVLNEMN